MTNDSRTWLALGSVAMVVLPVGLLSGMELERHLGRPEVTATVTLKTDSPTIHLIAEPGTEVGSFDLPEKDSITLTFRRHKRD